MNTPRHWILLASVAWAVPAFPGAHAAEPGRETASETVLQKKLTMNFRDLEVQSALALISTQAEFPIEAASDLSRKISYVANDLPLKQILDELTLDNGLEYSMRNGTIWVSATGNAPAAGGSGEIRMIPLRYSNPTEMAAKVSPLMGKADRLMADDGTNSLVFYGTASTFDKVSQLAAMLDAMPKQVQIQGLIIETNQNFLQNIGFSIGSSSVNATTTTPAGTAAKMSNPGPTGPNFSLTGTALAGGMLDLSLAAAESNGDAKVISRPRVITMNNKAAQINSGLTLSVKTLSATQSGQPGGAPTAVAGGLSQVNAGLTLTITPTIIGDGQVKLVVSINSSSPDNTQSVDGIPGVQNNAATTTVIVDNDRTAIIAGLIKQSKSLNAQGIPFLMDIPILGHFFKNDNRTDLNNELAIFITPTILKAARAEVMYPQPPSPRAMLDSVGEPQKPRPDSQSFGAPK